MSLLKALLNTGIQAHDAQVLDQYYADQDLGAFLDGLEETARVLGLQAAPLMVTLTADPWKAIHAGMLAKGDADAAFLEYLATLDNRLQLAIVGAVGVRMAELRQWAQQLQSQGKRRKTAEYIQILQRLGYTFRYNQCKLQVEVNGKPIEDMQVYEINSKLRDAGIYEVTVVEEAYKAEAWSKRYHPIKDYLLGLKFRGGDPISELGSYFADSDGVFTTWLRRWCVGAVSRVMAHTQNRMLVLEGAQRMGKDHFAKWLCSGVPEYFRESEIHPDDKDHKIYLLSTWIWDAQELGSTTRRQDREALKSFLTLNTITERLPYGHFPVSGPAITSFIGTANNESGLLNDPTGNRRFMIAHLQAIDWAYAKLDVDQVWAQAVDLYLNDEPYELQPDERRLAEEINDRYMTIDLVEETISRFFEVDPDNQAWFMTTLEIMEVLKDPIRGNLKAGAEIDTRKLASALTKLGLDKPIRRRQNNQQARGYIGIRMRVP